MARPHGFDHFCNYLKGFENQYVIIGGGAASILMDDQQLEFRATKDVDLVVLTRSNELNTRILAYIKDGNYEEKGATDSKPKYYRFTKPQSLECPKMIEIFTRNELGLELEKGQHIIPIQNKDAERLSAILLDNEYFGLIRGNLVTSASGIPLINSIANICLKARAHRELFARKENGDTGVDQADIQKHLKDIWRLAVTLTGNEKVKLSATPATDIENAIRKLEALPNDQFKQVMGKIPGADRVALMGILKRVFLKK